MKPTPALLRVERQLTRDRATILDAADVELLARQLRRTIADSLPGLPAEALDLSDDLIRWNALGARCKDARGARWLRDAAVASGVPQYRVRAIERPSAPDSTRVRRAVGRDLTP